MITRNYDITIESGEDFLLTLWTSDDEGNPIDLTGATISAQLREYPEAAEYKQFTIEHNGEGGVILLTMPHEDTADIAYTSGVYDVFVTPSGGTVMKVMMGDATITPSVTKPVYGQIAYLLEFASEANFPPVGLTRRVYFSQATTKMYRWNGTAYVGYTDYYTKAEITTLLSGKSDVGHDHDARYYTETEMDTALALKANSADVYSKSDVDTALSAKEDIANLKALAYKDKADFYNDIDNLPSGYPPSPHNHDDRYYTEGEIDTALSGKSDTGHTHTMSDVTDLPTLGNLAEQDTVDWDTDIDDIPSEFPPEAHTHTMSEITDLPTLGTLAEQNTVDYETDIDNLPTLGALAEKDTVDWDTDIDDIPATFPPDSHSHTMSDVTDLPTLGALAEQDTVDYTTDVTNTPTLGSMAAVNDAPSDGEEYVRKDEDWAVSSAKKYGILTVDCGTVSSLPTTIYDANVTANHELIRAEISPKTAVLTDWTLTISDGSVTITGQIYGSATVVLKLCKSAS